MPRYFFSAESATLKADDAEGEGLADDMAAHRAAQQTAAELRGGSFDGGIITARDEDGRVVSEVPIGHGPLH
jgi:hypothetical protein